MMTNHFKTKAKALIFLKELLNKKWFMNQDVTTYDIVLKLVQENNPSAMRIRQSANRWYEREQLRVSLSESID